MMKTTPWKTFDGGQQRIRVKYGLDYEFARRYNQAPHFSATCDIEEKTRNGRWQDYGGGADHETIAKYFPELEPYLKWHFVSTEESMHYIANAKYWWDVAIGKIKSHDFRTDPREAFKSTVVFGGVPGEQIPYTNDWPDVWRWLRDRLPKLMGRFAADMETLGVLE